MADFAVQIQFNRLPQARALSRSQAADIIAAIAQQGRNIAVQSIHEQSAGEAQVRYSPTRTVTVSRPGDPPNTDTGNLANSIVARPIAPLRWSVDVGADYGLHLELGTSRMAARPFMTPMAHALVRDMPQFFNRFLGVL